MKKPLLSIFADGVRYDSLQYMPFTKTLNSVPLRSILGYSITCHPSMYTGVNPDKHGIAFHWIRSKQKYGPYRLLSVFPNFFPFSNPYIQAVISHFYAKFFLKKKARPFMGYGKILNLPMRFWKYLDINETRYWDDEGYIDNGFKTIFELVRRDKIRHHISGLHKPNLGMLDALKIANPKDFDWVYYFTGESDSISHDHNQHSTEGIEFLGKLDDFINARYNEFVDTYGENGFDFIFWSDHGHIPIETKYNLYSFFKKNDSDLRKVFHIIDSTTARFWSESKEERQKIIEIMSRIPECNFVKEEDYSKLQIAQDSNLYGNLFFYLNGGSVFTHTIHGFGLTTKSMHGYHPDDEGNLGLLVSNKKISSEEASLPDVFASSITSLGIEYDETAKLDGRRIIS